MTEVDRTPTPELHAMVQAKIHEAYYSARVLGSTHAQASENAASALMPIIMSVDENAHGRGEVMALTAVLETMYEEVSVAEKRSVAIVEKALNGRTVQ